MSEQESQHHHLASALPPPPLPSPPLPPVLFQSRSLPIAPTTTTVTDSIPVNGNNVRRTSLPTLAIPSRMSSNSSLLADVNSFIHPRLPPSPFVPASTTASSSSPFKSPHRSNLSRPTSSGTYSSIGTNGSSSGGSANNSAGTSGSTRPWVRDSDASSICSAGGSSCWSSGHPDGIGGEWIDEGGEVFKVGGMEFLDPRPEPEGAKLMIDRDDPYHVILKVSLPGFSLDNITVAMRRGHRVHIVADSYGENGGHFEKLVSLGSEVHSTAPRAEFNGTDLSVYVQRRQHPTRHAPPLSHTNSSSSPANESTTGPTEYFTSFADDPRRSSSYSSTSTASLSPPYTVDLTSTHSSSSSSPFLGDEEPIATATTATYSSTKSSSRNKIVGSEGAKLAAKQDREEASKRAKEMAKALPKMGVVRKWSFAEGSVPSPILPTTGSISTLLEPATPPTPSPTPSPVVLPISTLPSSSEAEVQKTNDGTIPLSLSLTSLSDSISLALAQSDTTSPTAIHSASTNSTMTPSTPIQRHDGNEKEGESSRRLSRPRLTSSNQTLRPSTSTAVDAAITLSSPATSPSASTSTSTSTTTVPGFMSRAYSFVLPSSSSSSSASNSNSTSFSTKAISPKSSLSNLIPSSSSTSLDESISLAQSPSSASFRSGHSFLVPIGVTTNGSNGRRSSSTSTSTSSFGSLGSLGSSSENGGRSNSTRSSRSSRGTGGGTGGGVEGAGEESSRRSSSSSISLVGRLRNEHEYEDDGDDEVGEGSTPRGEKTREEVELRLTSDSSSSGMSGMRFGREGGLSRESSSRRIKR